VLVLAVIGVILAVQYIEKLHSLSAAISALAASATRLWSSTSR
jgi:hypothetical protein